MSFVVVVSDLKTRLFINSYRVCHLVAHSLLLLEQLRQKESGVFYGWKLAGIGSFGNLMLQGGVMYVMNAFMEPMVDINGWSRAGLSVGMSLASVCGALSMPLSMALASRFSIRSIMSIGAFIGGMGFIGMGYVSQLWMFTVLFAVVWMCGQACGGVVANLLVGNWFQRSRGRALGIANMGTSLSGAVLPFIALLLVDSIGLTASYTLLGGIVLCFCPLCYWMVRDKPKEMGLFVDDTDPGLNPRTTVPLKTASIPWKDFFGHRQAWILGFAFGIGLASASSVVSQLKPHFVDSGMGSYLAMTCMCLTAFFGAVGKYLWGWLSDRTTPLFASKLLLLCNTLSLCFILLPPSLLNVSLFIVFYGICMGGLWTVLPGVIAYVYGMHRFSSAYKYISIFIMLRSAGYAIVGLSYSLTGAYDMAYGLMIVLMGLSFIAIVTLKESEAIECTHTNL